MPERGRGGGTYNLGDESSGLPVPYKAVDGSTARDQEKISINVQVHALEHRLRIYATGGTCERMDISRGQCTDVDSRQAEERGSAPAK
jgi:hypothetical protein